MIFTFEDGVYRLVQEPTDPKKADLPPEDKHVVFYYVRHGETRFNMWNRMQGACDSPLTQNGLHQAELAAKALKDVNIQKIYSSTSQRARQTAEIINGYHQVPVSYTKNLKEVNFGDFEAVVSDSWISEIRKRHETETWDDVHGENREQVRERICAVLNEAVLKAKNNDNVLLVSHGTLYLNILKELFGIDRESYYSERMKAGRQAMPNGGIFVFEYNNGRFSVRELMVSPDEFAR
jgi:broad specificity phosphatase PhoE